MRLPKRITIIRLLVSVWIFSLIALYFGVVAYINSKDNRLCREIHENISKVFNDRKFIDVEYFGYEAKYKSVRIPPKTHSEFEYLGIRRGAPIINDKWEEKYGDLTSLFQINPKNKEIGDGWNLITLTQDYEGVYITWLYPYAVGYRKQNDYWGLGEEYMPSIQSAVDAAFNFFTTDKESIYSADYQKGSYARVMSAIFGCNNEYYGIVQDSFRRIHRVDGKPLFEKYGKDMEEHPYQATYMYNGYYKVFVAETQPTTYSIEKWGRKLDDDKNKLLLWWSIGMTIIMLVIVIPLSIKERHERKKQNESLYQRMLRLCNPERFMKNYDQEKVEIANSIYQSLLALSDNPESPKIEELRELAEQKLGLTFISPDDLQELRDKVNPQNFMHPYNPEKVTKANELYSLLSKEGLTYRELDEIKKRIKDL